MADDMHVEKLNKIVEEQLKKDKEKEQKKWIECDIKEGACNCMLREHKCLEECMMEVVDEVEEQKL